MIKRKIKKCVHCRGPKRPLFYTTVMKYNSSKLQFYLAFLPTTSYSSAIKSIAYLTRH